MATTQASRVSRRSVQLRPEPSAGSVKMASASLELNNSITDSSSSATLSMTAPTQRTAGSSHSSGVMSMPHTLCQPTVTN